jgi:hypothetical protein
MELIQQASNHNTLLTYEQFYIQKHHHQKRLIHEQYTGDVNPIFQLIYDTQNTSSLQDESDRATKHSTTAET